MEFLTPWYADTGDALVIELEREVPTGHLLRDVAVRSVARRQDKDDILFALQDGTGRVAVVHLTWHVETDPAWPSVSMFQDLSSWLETMERDHAEFEG
jgi:hypothetical protein